MIAAFFEIPVFLNVENLVGLDFKCYLKTGSFSIFSQYLGLFLITAAFVSQGFCGNQRDSDQKFLSSWLDVNFLLALLTLPFCVRDLVRRFEFIEITDSILATFGYVLVSGSGIVFYVMFKRIFEKWRNNENHETALLPKNSNQGAARTITNENELI